jgi:cytochrome c553
MQSTAATKRRATHSATPWLGITALYLLAAAPLAHAADADIAQKAETCVACHGPNGQSSDPTIPSLAGQTSRYLYDELRDFQAGRRNSATMIPIAKTLSTDDMQALADEFSAKRPMSSSYATDPAKVAHGQSIAANALCTMCHEAGLAGQNEVPRLAGQQYAYIVKALESFRDGHRTNDAGAMLAVVRGVSDQDIEALAQYVSGLN